MWKSSGLARGWGALAWPPWPLALCVGANLTLSVPRLCKQRAPQAPDGTSSGSLKPQMAQAGLLRTACTGMGQSNAWDCVVLAWLSTWSQHDVVHVLPLCVYMCVSL